MLHLRSINDYKGTIEQIVASYEVLILPPFFKVLSDYVGDNNAQFAVQDIKEDSFSLSILRDVPFMISLEIIFSVQTFVMPM